MIRFSTFNDETKIRTKIELSDTSALKLLMSYIRCPMSADIANIGRQAINYEQSNIALLSRVKESDSRLDFSGNRESMEPLFLALYAYLTMYGVKHEFDGKPGGILLENGEYRLPLVSAQSVTDAAALYGIGIDLDEAIDMSSRRSFRLDDALAAYDLAAESGQDFRTLYNALAA